MKYNYVISLGSACFTSWVCKELQLKKFSCPFDWIFSEHNELGPYYITTNCIKDNFECFLDQSQYSDYVENVRSASHKKYGTIFLHHDPRIKEDHNYFKRCVSRFTNVCSADESVNILFVLTFINKSANSVSDLISKMPELIDALKRYVKPKFTVLLFVHVSRNNTIKIKTNSNSNNKKEYFIKNLYNNESLLTKYKLKDDEEFSYPNDNFICKTVNTMKRLSGYKFAEKEINDKFTNYIKDNFEFDLYDVEI